jgi:hypothetical protein
MIASATGSTKPRVEMFKLYDPPEWALLKVVDAQLYKAGQPNVFDTLNAL